MIVGFIGQRGSGKTLTMVRYAYEKFKQGYKIYSNINLNFKHTIYTVDDLMEYAEKGEYFGKTLLICDEIHIFFDSRSSGKTRNRIFSYMLNQSSKNDMDVAYTTQFSRQVEIRLRLNTEIVNRCVCKSIVWKNKNSKPQVLLNYRPKDSDYKCVSVIQNEIFKFNDTGLTSRKISRYVGNPYFKLYNTREVVRMQSDKYEREKTDKKSNKKLTEREKVAKWKREDKARLINEEYDD